MSDLRRQALELLDEIGGDVQGSEVIYHLNDAAFLELFEAARDDLVEAKTYFTLTDRGRELIASPSPEGSLAARLPAELSPGSPAPGPGGAGDDLPPTGFAACHGRAA